MTVAVALDRVPWSEDNKFCLSSCSTAFLVRFMTRSISGFWGIIMSRRVASVIAGDEHVRPRESCALLCIDSFP